MIHRNHHARRGTPVIVVASGLAERYIVRFFRDRHWIRIQPCEHVFKIPPANCPAVVIVDLGSIRGPLEAHLETLRARVPEARPLILAEQASKGQVWSYLLHGARGLVRYQHIQCDLLRAVRALSADELWFSLEDMAAFADHVSRLSRKKDGARGAFTSRQKAVLESLREGLCNKEISAMLGVSEATVKFHLKNIYGMLGVHNRHAAAEVAMAGSLTDQFAGPGVGREACFSTLPGHPISVLADGAGTKRAA